MSKGANNSSDGTTLMVNRLVTVREACQVLAIGRSTLYTLIAQGKLHPIRDGGRTRFLAMELHKYVNELAREAGAVC